MTRLSGMNVVLVCGVRQGGVMSLLLLKLFR